MALSTLTSTSELRARLAADRVCLLSSVPLAYTDCLQDVFGRPAGEEQERAEGEGAALDEEPEAESSGLSSLGDFEPLVTDTRARQQVEGALRRRSSRVQERANREAAVQSSPLVAQGGRALRKRKRVVEDDGDA